MPSTKIRKSELKGTKPHENMCGWRARFDMLSSSEAAIVHGRMWLTT